MTVFEWLLDPLYWNWFLLGLVLGIAEVFVPGTFLLWLGIAAGVVGLLLVLFPELDWIYQWLIFALLAIIAVVVWLRYFKGYSDRSDDPLLNRRGHQYVDRVFSLDGPIVNGQGRLKVDDSTWKVSGPDCSAGSRVRVVDVDGVVLQVEVETESEYKAH